MLHDPLVFDDVAKNWPKALDGAAEGLPARYRERRTQLVSMPAFGKSAQGWSQNATERELGKHRALGRWVDEGTWPRAHELEFVNYGFYVQGPPRTRAGAAVAPPVALHAPFDALRPDLAAAREQLEAPGPRARNAHVLGGRREPLRWSQPLTLHLLRKSEAHWSRHSAARPPDVALGELGLQNSRMERWFPAVPMPAPHAHQGPEPPQRTGWAHVAAGHMCRQLDRLGLVHGISPWAAHVAVPGNSLEFLDLATWQPLRPSAAHSEKNVAAAGYGALEGQRRARPTTEEWMTRLLGQTMDELRRLPRALGQQLAAAQTASAPPSGAATPVPLTMKNMAAQLEAMRAQIAALEADASKQAAPKVAAATVTATATASTPTARVEADAPDRRAAAAAAAAPAAPAPAPAPADAPRPAAAATATVTLPAADPRFNRRRDEALLSRWLPGPVARVADQPPWAYLQRAGQDPSWRNLVLALPMTVLSVALHVLDALAAIIAYFHSNGMFALLNIALTLYLRGLRVV